MPWLQPKLDLDQNPLQAFIPLLWHLSAFAPKMKYDIQLLW